MKKFGITAKQAAAVSQKMSKAGRIYLKPPIPGVNEFNRRNFLSIRRAKNCLYSRRNGIKGLLIFGLSICLRIGGRDII